MKNSYKILIIILGLFLYLSVKIAHDRTVIEYGKIRRQEIKLLKRERALKYSCDSLKSYGRIVKIAKEKMNMAFLKGNRKKVIEYDK